MFVRRKKSRRKGPKDIQLYVPHYQPALRSDYPVINDFNSKTNAYNQLLQSGWINTDKVKYVTISPPEDTIYDFAVYDYNELKTPGPTEIQVYEQAGYAPHFYRFDGFKVFFNEATNARLIVIGDDYYRTNVTEQTNTHFDSKSMAPFNKLWIVQNKEGNTFAMYTYMNKTYTITGNEIYGIYIRMPNTSGSISVISIPESLIG